MRIRPAGYTGRNRWRVEATRRKFKNRFNLLPRDIVLLDDFLNARTYFEVFKDRGDRHPGIAEHPRANENQKWALIADGTRLTRRVPQPGPIATGRLHRSYEVRVEIR